MKQFFTLIIILIISLPAGSQNAALNWANVGWDCSSADIEKKYPGRLLPVEKPQEYAKTYCTHKLENILIHGHPFTAMLSMDRSSNGLTQVMFVSEAVESTDEFPVEKGKEYFRQLMEALTSDFGPPVMIEVKSYGKTAHWFTDSTNLSLAYLHMEGIGYHQLSVNSRKPYREFNFRQTKWGFTMEQVKENERLELVMEQDTLLGYSAQLQGINCLLGYFFNSDRLAKTMYIFQDEHIEENEYINDYRKIKAYLSRTYGTPDNNEDEVWYDETYRANQMKWGKAVKEGHMMMQNSWHGPETSVTLYLVGMDQNIDMVMEISPAVK